VVDRAAAAGARAVTPFNAPLVEGFTVWLTGLSGAGKSTIARALGHRLSASAIHTEILDGDEVRRGLSQDLTFSAHDRDINVRRIGYVANLLSRNGVVVIVAAISPQEASRAAVRAAHERAVVEVFVDCPLAELIRRDPKGLYARALKGEIELFTGVSAPYEAPTRPDVHVRTDRVTVDQAVAEVVRELMARQLLVARDARDGCRQGAE
jgi:adenylylsulfate kinase